MGSWANTGSHQYRRRVQRACRDNNFPRRICLRLGPNRDAGAGDARPFAHQPFDKGISEDMQVVSGTRFLVEVADRSRHPPFVLVGQWQWKRPILEASIVVGQVGVVLLGGLEDRPSKASPVLWE